MDALVDQLHSLNEFNCHVVIQFKSYHFKTTAQPLDTQQVVKLKKNTYNLETQKYYKSNKLNQIINQTTISYNQLTSDSYKGKSAFLVSCGIVSHAGIPARVLDLRLKNVQTSLCLIDKDSSCNFQQLAVLLPSDLWIRFSFRRFAFQFCVCSHEDFRVLGMLLELIS